jgi:hypothetical protein
MKQGRQRRARLGLGWHPVWFGCKKSAARELRQSRTNYRCFRQDLAGFARRHSIAPDSIRSLGAGGGRSKPEMSRGVILIQFSQKAIIRRQSIKNLAMGQEIRVVFNPDPR